MVVHFEMHVANGDHLPRRDAAVGRHDLRACGGLVGPALQQGAPGIALDTLDGFYGFGQGVNGQFRPLRQGKRMVAQPMVAMKVAVEHRHHRQGGDAADHPQSHLANLQRAARIQNHHPGRGDDKADVGHHAPVFGGGKAIGRVNHPHPGRDALRCDVGHRCAGDEVLGLLRQHMHIGPQTSHGQSQGRRAQPAPTRHQLRWVGSIGHGAACCLAMCD